MVLNLSWALLVAVVVLCSVLLTAEARLSGDCVTVCNDLRLEVLTLEICRDAKRTLPRPKVGDFCSSAMEQAFSDACIALCEDQAPIARVSQTCRAAAIEMPRPTVRRWCEHGYNVAFEKTVRDLGNYFHPSDSAAQTDADGSAEEGMRQTPSASSFADHSGRGVYTGSGAQAAAAHANAQQQQQQQQQHPVVATIPITLDDNVTKDLLVHEGQSAEEAVVEFCREHVSEDVGGCIRQLLSVVIEKMNELSLNA